MHCIRLHLIAKSYAYFINEETENSDVEGYLARISVSLISLLLKAKSLWSLPVRLQYS